MLFYFPKNPRKYLLWNSIQQVITAQLTIAISNDLAAHISISVWSYRNFCVDLLRRRSESSSLRHDYFLCFRLLMKTVEQFSDTKELPVIVIELLKSNDCTIQSSFGRIARFYLFPLYFLLVLINCFGDMTLKRLYIVYCAIRKLVFSLLRISSNLIKFL